MPATTTIVSPSFAKFLIFIISLASCIAAYNLELTKKGQAPHKSDSFLLTLISGVITTNNKLERSLDIL